MTNAGVKTETIELELLTPVRLLLKESVRFVALPGIEGELGVLPGHTPLVTALKYGEIRVRDQQGIVKKFAVSGGFVQIGPKHIIVLADTAEPALEIDVDRAKRAHERALKRLAQKQETIDMARARAALLRAEARLKAAGRF